MPHEKQFVIYNISETYFFLCVYTYVFLSEVLNQYIGIFKGYVPFENTYCKNKYVKNLRGVTQKYGSKNIVRRREISDIFYETTKWGVFADRILYIFRILHFGELFKS